MSEDVIRMLPTDEIDSELAEEWVRETDDQEVRGVGASRWHDGTWQVELWVAEFLREEPLESEMRRGIDAALRDVEGVTDVVEEDREVWVVEGTPPSGEALVRAAAVVVDHLAPRARAYLDSR